MSNKNNSSAWDIIKERLINGVLKENPTFVLLLGMCPTLAVTTCASNGLGMGLTTLVVLALSNLMISALRKVIPNKMRIPAFIVIIASFVTIVEMLLQAYIPSLYEELGLYIPLIVVNCIILGRAEAYAYSHGPLGSFFDGVGMGLGFTVALTLIGAFREILGAGQIFGNTIMPSGYVPVSIFVMAPGAFFVLAMLTAIQNKIKEEGTKRGKDMSKIGSGCGGNCLTCDKECKVVVKEKPVAKDVMDVSNEASTTEATVDEKPKKVKKEKAKKVEETPDEPKEEPKDNKDKKTSSKDKEVSSKDEEPVEPVTKEAFATETEVKETSDSNEKEEEPKKELKKEPKKTAKKVSKKVEAPIEEPEANAEPETSNDEEDGLELLDMDDYKKAIEKKKTSQGKAAPRVGNRSKAQAMLFKAEETLKEDE